MKSVFELPVIPGREEPYRTPSTSLGGCRLPDVDDVAGALALAEGEGFR